MKVKEKVMEIVFLVRPVCLFWQFYWSCVVLFSMVFRHCKIGPLNFLENCLKPSNNLFGIYR